MYVLICASLPIYYAALKQRKKEPKLLLASNTEISLLSSLTNMGPLKAPTSIYSVICLDQEHLAFLGAHYIYTIQASTPDLNQTSRILAWFICTLNSENPFCTQVWLKSRCADLEES